MSRVRQTAEQEAGKQLKQGAKVYSGKNMQIGKKKGGKKRTNMMMK